MLNKPLRAMLVITVFCLLASSPVRAGGRMAGSMPGEIKTDSQTNENSAALKMDYNLLESYGTLEKSSEGALGRDLWHGIKRSALLAYLPQISTETPYRTIQDLSRRLLLNASDARFIKRDEDVVPGNDLTTLRLEKLLEMGAYAEAVQLYTRHPEPPYHERFARAGILAALYNRQPALACLETRVAAEQFAQKDVVFWQQLSKICTYILSKEGQEKTENIEIPGSKLLQKIVDKKRYRYKVRKPADLKDLKIIEAAILAADNRFDLSGMKIKNARALPAHVLRLLMDDPSLPDEQRFQLALDAGARGLITIQDLIEFYEDQADSYFDENKKTSLTGYQEIKGWKRLAYLYRATKDVKQEQEKTAIIKKALALIPTYGTVAMWPFAPILAETDPTELDSQAIRQGFSILLESGRNIPLQWAKIRFNGINDGDTSDEDELRQYAAYRTGEIFNKDSNQAIDFSSSSSHLIKKLPPTAKIFYEKLDSGVILHDIDASKTYEKAPGLTSKVDYVMPFTGLMENLKSAEDNRCLGEVVLLSAIVLRDMPPENIKGGLLREVIDGLVTVGLTKEARSLAREVVLGLNE